jgi:RNA polymerase sigma factor (sigma-70 family)
MYIENQEDLYKQWYGLVIHVIHKKYPWAIRDTGTGSFRKVRRAVDVWDLKQEGWQALLMANENFNPELGYKFKTYAYRVIYNRILNYIDANCTPITIARRRHVLASGSEASKQKLEAATNYVCFSELSNRVAAKAGSTEIPYNPLPTRDEAASQDPAIQLEEHDFHEHCIKKLKRGLTATEYKILLMRYDHKTYAEIGRKMDLSTERIRQILEAANYKIRSILYTEIEDAGCDRQADISIANQVKLQRQR